ncbi:MAG: hypothetical protein ABIV28_06980 [Longimicrobiales bacterium]
MISIHARNVIAIVFAFVIAGCTGADDAPSPDAAATDPSSSTPLCIAERVATLPSVLSEASGVTASHAYPGILWAHNDGDTDYIGPTIVAIDTLGSLHGSIRIAGLPRDSDREDIAIAPCGGRDCIYVADIGDNAGRRPAVRILRFPEPDPDVDSDVAQPDVFIARYPDRAHDAEAFFILPGERAFIITKGRDGPVALYAYPAPLRADTVTLTHVQDLSTGLVQLPSMVTGASAAVDGRFIAVRTYSFVRRFAPGAGDSLHAVADSIPLAALREPQGEGVALTSSGTLFFVSENGFANAAPPLGRMTCH